MGSVLNRILIAVTIGLLSAFAFALIWGPRRATAAERSAAGNTAQVSQSEFSHALKACESGERWSFSTRIDPTWRRTFQEFLSGRLPPVRSFAEGLALRKQAAFGENRVFAEYWVSRSLYEAGLIHTAHRGLAVVAAASPEAEYAGVQAAAIACLVRIHRRFPSLSIPRPIAARLVALSRIEGSQLYRGALRDAAAMIALEAIGDAATGNKGAGKAIDRLIGLLKGAGPIEDLTRGAWAAARADHKAAAVWLRSFLDSSLPSELKRYRDPATLLLARALYTMGRYDDAVAALQSMDRESNELTHAMSELSWAFLLAGKQREAVGTAVALQSGNFRWTFAPEAVMVMAMALNELCRYPESLQALQSFRSRYRPAFGWLTEWRAGKNGGTSLYRLAVGFLKGDRRTVPPQIANEWVRSPVFISHQQQINLLFNETEGTGRLGKLGAVEQKKMAEDLLKLAKSLRERYVRAKIKMGPKDGLPKDILNDLAELKFKVITYRRFREAAPVWGQILKIHRVRSPQIERGLMRAIDQTLARMSRRMLKQLENVAENNQLVEVEIYNGATQDIIWQNAHPDYKKVARQIEERKSARVNKEAVWNWGEVASGLDGSGEIWEDEVGSFQAKLYDNCENKHRYLALKKEEMLRSN